MVTYKDSLPQPPAHVPKGKWDLWFEYWAKIYLDRDDNEAIERNNERIANATSDGSEVEAD